MIIDITFRINYRNDKSTSRFTVKGKWKETTCLDGHFKQDFDWEKKNDRLYFGRHIEDRAISAVVYIKEF